MKTNSPNLSTSIALVLVACVFVLVAFCCVPLPVFAQTNSGDDGSASIPIIIMVCIAIFIGLSFLGTKNAYEFKETGDILTIRRRGLSRMCFFVLPATMASIPWIMLIFGEVLGQSDKKYYLLIFFLAWSGFLLGYGMRFLLEKTIKFDKSTRTIYKGEKVLMHYSETDGCL